MLGKPLGINRGRRDHHTEIGAAWQKVFKVAQQKINVQAALVGLIDDQGVIGHQQWIVLGLRQKHAIGHELDRDAGPGAVIETDLIAHGCLRLVAAGCSQFLSDAPCHGHGREPPRLRVADGAARKPAAKGQGNLWQLGGFARAGLTTHDDHGVLPNRVGDLLPTGADRE